MSMYQDFLIVSDIDGTLANSEHIVSEKNKQAIAHFVAEGGHFAVATGRTQKNVVPYLTGVTINAPCILYNGGALYSWQEQQFLRTRHMPSREMADFLRHCMRVFPGICIEIFTQEQLYVVTEPGNLDEHMKREKQEFAYAKLEDILDQTWIKILLCDHHDHLLECRRLLTTFQLAAKTHNFFSAVTYLEIVDQQVSKGSMLAELMKLEVYKDKTVIAAGDFQNDVEMLQLAHYGIAPANAQEEVKAAAAEIAVSNDEDLLADIIYRILPEIQEKAEAIGS